MTLLKITGMAAALTIAGAVSFASAAVQTIPGSVNTPDINVSALEISYDATTDMFAADNSFATVGQWQESDMTPSVILTNPVIDIDAVFDEMGTVTSGSLTISGALPMMMDEVLLTGTLLQAGADSINIQLLWNVTGGSLASFYGNGQAITIVAGSGYAGGDFTSDFDTLFTGTSDTRGVSVDAPAALPLMLGGIAAAVAFRGRRSAK